jgi:multicomponent Na+:H+ antiporter subunit E
MFDMHERVRHPAMPAEGGQIRPRSPRRRRLRSALIAGSVLAGLWSLLTGFDPASWMMGIPAILIGAGLVWLLPPARPWRIAPGAALSFALFFVWQSVRGALDVAARALDPRLPLAPGFRTIRLTLRPGPGRVLIANTISLLPGTLSVELSGTTLTLHTLDTGADTETEIASIEKRVAAVFGERP